MSLVRLFGLVVVASFTADANIDITTTNDMKKCEVTSGHCTLLCTEAGNQYAIDKELSPFLKSKHCDCMNQCLIPRAECPSMVPKAEACEWKFELSLDKQGYKECADKCHEKPAQNSSDANPNSDDDSDLFAIEGEATSRRVLAKELMLLNKYRWGQKKIHSFKWSISLERKSYDLSKSMEENKVNENDSRENNKGWECTADGMDAMKRIYDKWIADPKSKAIFDDKKWIYSAICVYEKNGCFYVSQLFSDRFVF